MNKTCFINKQSPDTQLLSRQKLSQLKLSQKNSKNNISKLDLSVEEIYKPKSKEKVSALEEADKNPICLRDHPKMRMIQSSKNRRNSQCRIEDKLTNVNPMPRPKKLNDNLVLNF